MSAATAGVRATEAPGQAAAPRHTLVEDVLAILAGTVTTSLGLFLLKTAGAVTGGTAGLSLLVSYATAVPFGVLFFGVNLPFFVLALWKKGLAFTVRTVVAVGLISVFSGLMPSILDVDRLDPVYGVLAGNLLAGVGILILFRHGSSLGGFNILALVLQERLGWRAGYVQMALDVAVVLASFAVMPPLVVLLSAAGAVVLNLVLALNHRPGRYRA